MSDRAFADLTLAHIETARARVRGAAVRTPLVRLHVPRDHDGAPREIWLKLENLQPIGAFKIRGAANAFVMAGASSVAAALAGKAGTGKVVCVASGGKIDRTTPCRILANDAMPRSSAT